MAAWGELDPHVHISMAAPGDVGEDDLEFGDSFEIW